MGFRDPIPNHEIRSQSMASGVRKSVLVVGIGNIDRGDDGAGIAVARHIRARISPRIPVAEHSGEGTSLIELWQMMNAQTVYLIDAMCSDLPSGTIQRFDAHDSSLPAQFFDDYSTHSFGIVQAVELARVLNCLPPQIIIYGIEGLCFDADMPLSAEVEAAVLKTVELIMSELFPHL